MCIRDRSNVDSVVDGKLDTEVWRRHSDHIVGQLLDNHIIKQQWTDHWVDHLLLVPFHVKREAVGVIYDRHDVVIVFPLVVDVDDVCVGDGLLCVRIRSRLVADAYVDCAELLSTGVVQLNHIIVK